ncbi:hypothetical protein L9F63_020872 [Diploptera punctata]|uniref:Uncharacterized protein n=1 Tax=Diploptera punctata TaxID=6984 RepID=A0AAD7ZPZ9_DIPPU|nr:hypothetical protein L9F63_020872 [Diploptera punctata]
MFGYIGCVEMKWKFTEKCIFYFHIFDCSNDLTVYLTDSCEFLTSIIPFHELKNACRKFDIDTDNKIIGILKNSIKPENLNYDERENLLKVSLCVEHKSSDISLKFSTIVDPEERRKHLKTLLFNLARIAQDTSTQSQLAVEKADQISNYTPTGSKGSVISSKSAAKRQGPPMSIINPGSKRIRQKTSKIDYEEESDS